MSFKQIPNLQRYPDRKNDPLQAWDAADELLLEHLQGESLEGKRILIINDLFGALSCGLSKYDCSTYTDSYVSFKGIELNSEGKILAMNKLSAFNGVYDFVILRIPKNLSFLEDILSHLTAHLNSESKIICGSMIKHLPSGAFDFLQKYIGETSTSLAQKKARLIFAKFERDKTLSPYPVEVRMEGFDKSFIHNSNLFSREKLDIGTRFFLEHIPKGSFKNILDLGCANGIIGIRAKQLNSDARIYFSDESAMAIESARVNYEKFFSDPAIFYWTNCFEEGEEKSQDLILCNPPFHQGTTIGDFIAVQMFRDAHRALRVGGILRVIGNSHLRYHQDLKKIFGNVKTIATNNKFIIWESKRTT